MRTGLIAKKIGMSRIFSEGGEHIPVTLLKVEDCEVISIKTQEKDGYNAVQLGAFNKKVKNISKPVRGHFAKNKVEPKAKINEFRVSEDALLKSGDVLSVEHFVSGQKVDVTSVSIGKGFQGAMKRWNFGGLEATHGISVSHRSHGSTGQCQDPGRVFKGKKMAGQMGNTQITAQNLDVVATDLDKGLIAVKGAVPGSKNSFVTINDAVKVKAPADLPYPAALIVKEDSKKAEAKESANDESKKVEESNDES